MKRFLAVITTIVLAVSLLLITALPLSAGTSTYTTDVDFGPPAVSNNVVVVGNGVPAYLQLDDTVTPFDFIWVAVSSRGTAVKIDINTGAVLGEYMTSLGQNGDPSRTTVDNNGNVWVANRAFSPGTIIHIASVPTDVDNDGTIETSSGLGDILPWGMDEAVLHYVTVNSFGTRHLSVDANNDVWVSGLFNRAFDLVDGDTGAIITTYSSVGFGGYGGLIDGNGVIWSANPLLRWDTANPLAGPNGWIAMNVAPNPNWAGYPGDSYGLGIDSSGNVWNTQLSGNAVRKFAPNGVLIGTYAHGSFNAQGVVAGLDDHIWVAHSLYAGNDTVGHILNNGTFIGNVDLEPAVINDNVGPTGVAVDANGKIWTTGYLNGKVYRIDPTAGPIGADLVTPVGAVDLVVNVGGSLYNYSDMTGSTLIAPPDNGSWTVVNDSTIPGAKWTTISWTADEPGDSSIEVSVASSDDGVTYGPLHLVSNGQNMQGTVADGQYLKIVGNFKRSSSDDDGNGIKDSPKLNDLSVAHNQPPTANAGPDQTLEQTSYDGAEVTLDGSASSDPNGDTLTYEWTWDGKSATGVGPTIVFPLGTTTVTLTVDDGQFTDDDTVDITVVDTTSPVVTCVEAVNPAGKNVPPAGRTTLPGAKGGNNDDGFYQLFAGDICDSAPQIWVGTADNPNLFGPFESGIIVKFTEAKGAVPSINKIGSDNGQAGAVTWHITLPSDPVVTAIDNSGNSASCTCLVPPLPK